MPDLMVRELLCYATPVTSLVFSKVIDETLRVVNVSLFTYREAKTDVNICGKSVFLSTPNFSFFRFPLFFFFFVSFIFLYLY